MRVFKKSSGFTLIELLVVIAIIGLLSTIALTNLSASRTRARDIGKINDLKRIEKALQLYEVDYDQLPPVELAFLWDDGNRANDNDLTDKLIKYLPAGLPTTPNNSLFIYCKNLQVKKKYLLATVLEQNSDFAGDVDGMASSILYRSQMCVTSDNDHLEYLSIPAGTIDCDDSNGGRVDQRAGTDFYNRTVFCLGYIN